MSPTITQLSRWGRQDLTHVCLILQSLFWTSLFSCFPSGTRCSQLQRNPKRTKGPVPYCSSEGSMATLGSESGPVCPISLSLSQPTEQMEASRKRDGACQWDHRGREFRKGAGLDIPIVSHPPLAFHFVPVTPFWAFLFPLDR